MLPALTSRPQARLHSGSAALHRRLEFVQQLGIGEVLGDEAMQLRGAEGLEEAGEAQPHHVGVVAGHRRQQALGLLPVRVARIEQAGHRGVDDLHDA